MRQDATGIRLNWGCIKCVNCGLIFSIMEIKEITKGKLTVKDAALICDLSVQAIYKWEKTGKVPPGHVIAISRATGWLVTPYDLRPDIYPHPDDGLPKIHEAAA